MLQLKKTTTTNFRFSMSSKVCSKPKNVHLKWFLQYMYCAASDPPPLDIICFCKFSPLIGSLVFTAALFEYCIGERKKPKKKKPQSDMTALGFSCWLNKGCNQWLWSSLIRQQFQSEHTVLRAQDRIDHCLHTGLQPKTPKKSMRQQIQSKQDPTLIFTIYPAHVSANHCNCFSNRSHSDSISKHQNEVF